MNIPSRGAARRIAAAALLAAGIASCAPLNDLVSPSAPGVADEWPGLLDEIRVFERRIGFQDTDNFGDLSQDEEAFAYCGYASKFRLPYSYEDPAIRWLDSVTERECREAGQGNDILFGHVEAVGENRTPVTRSMVKSRVDRFLYLVIHEDCHDQFDLPYGIEEALCDLITYKAMAAFSGEKYAWYARESRAIRRYADEQARLARATIAYYERLAALYARYQRGEMASDALLEERAAIFTAARQDLAWTKGELNNVGIANDMTYSRHYPYLEHVYEALGRDLARTVAFFRRVDDIKPSAAAVMKQHRIAAENSVEFLRAYEEAVLEAAKRLLRQRGGGNPS